MIGETTTQRKFLRTVGLVFINRLHPADRLPTLWAVYTSEVLALKTVKDPGGSPAFRCLGMETKSKAAAGPSQGEQNEFKENINFMTCTTVPWPAFLDGNRKLDVQRKGPSEKPWDLIMFCYDRGGFCMKNHEDKLFKTMTHFCHTVWWTMTSREFLEARDVWTEHWYARGRFAKRHPTRTKIRLYTPQGWRPMEILLLGMSLKL